MRSVATNPDEFRFDDFEIAGWRRLAVSYHTTLGPLTSAAAESILAAAQPREGDRLLDIGSGPGCIAAAAADAGLSVTGCDISESMVDLARSLHPNLDFDLADARALPYGDESFDVVTLGFLLLHTALPDLMVSEAVRVLRPGGRLVASVYDDPSRARFVGLFGEATRGIHLTPPTMPPGPSLFDLVTAPLLEELLADAGLTDVEVQSLAVNHRLADAGEMYDQFKRGTVRAAAPLEAQDAATESLIVDALADKIEPYRVDAGYSIPAAFLLATGRKPA